MGNMMRRSDDHRALRQARRDYLNLIKAMAKAIDGADPYMRGHCKKVMRYSVIICKRLSLSEEDAAIIKCASLLHDVGKIDIDLSIISKPGPLTKSDWSKVRKHPEVGAKIVGRGGLLNEFVPIIKYHHARYDGGGYPEPGRRDGRIPIGARIIAVADAFDAMTSDRPYRKAMSTDEAIEELKKCSGSQFDPKVVKAFLGPKAS